MNKEIATKFEFTKVMQSNIHGLGLFAKCDIPRGTVWWKGEPDKNILLFNKEQYINLRNSETNGIKPMFWKMFTTYSYYSAIFDSLILCLDNARYVNHSSDPNSGPNPDRNPLISIALRDIKEGEEILENYDEYDICPWVEILKFDI